MTFVNGIWNAKWIGAVRDDLGAAEVYASGGASEGVVMKFSQATCIPGSIATIMAVLALAPPVAMADVYKLTLTGVTQTYQMGGVYTDPYKITVTDPTNKHSTQFLALACDDFNTNINVNQTWYAATEYLNTLTDTTVTKTGPQKFVPKAPSTTYGVWGAGVDKTPSSPPSLSSATYKVTIQEAYYMAGFIAEQMIQAYDSNPNSLAPYASGIDSFAIWEIFDPTAWMGYNHVLPLKNIPKGNQEITDVNNLLAVAYAAATIKSPKPLPYTLEIYTPCSRSQYPCPSTYKTSVSQEFLGIGSLNPDVKVPEASSIAVLGFDLSAVAAVLFFARRRLFS